MLEIRSRRLIVGGALLAAWSLLMSALLLLLKDAHEGLTFDSLDSFDLFLFMGGATTFVLGGLMALVGASMGTGARFETILRAIKAITYGYATIVSFFLLRIIWSTEASIIAQFGWTLAILLFAGIWCIGVDHISKLFRRHHLP